MTSLTSLRLPLKGKHRQPRAVTCSRCASRCCASTVDTARFWRSSRSCEYFEKATDL